MTTSLPQSCVPHPTAGDETKPQLKRELPQRSIAENFGAYAGKPLLLPVDAAFPKDEFLAEYRAVDL